MKSKKIITATLSLLLCALLVTGTINVVVDPLFQYHKPWFGLKPNIIDERYQNAGIAKNFDFKNVIIGNSMTENFLVSDVEKVLNGKTVKLSASGSNVLYWTYLLNILEQKKERPQNILFNLDSGFFDSSDKSMKYNLPIFLYDNNFFNDVEYLFNFAITQKYTFGTLKANISGNVPEYDKAFVWGYEKEIGKNVVLKEYESSKEERLDSNTSIKFYTEGNLLLLSKYFESMPDTQFIFFCSPFSVLYWKDKFDSGLLNEYKKQFEKTFEFMSQYDNVIVYFWTDEEILNIISNLDNYKDSTHYGMHINKDMLMRIGKNIGELPKEKNEWKTLLDKYFDYLESFDYTTIFE